MASNPPEGFPQITPYLLYKDVDAALEWLTDVVGFKESARLTGPEGKTVHAEVKMGTGVVMLGSPSGEFQSPDELGMNTQVIFVYVDEVDKHFEHAKSMGADIVGEPKDEFYGDRVYRIKDSEGHMWNFAQHVKDVALEDMHP